MVAKSIKKKTIRFKVIKPVYETLTVKTEDDIDVSLPITGSQRVYDLFKFLIAETREYFWAVHLDSKNKILCLDQISIGSLNASIVHPREVFKSVLISSAAGLLLVHNHPSGVPEPSSEDYEITSRLNELASMLGVRLLDHVIIGDGAYVSFADRGLLEASTSTWPKIIKA
jgi:DNA repair protein RadC